MNTLETTRNLFYDRPSWTKNELAQQTSLSMAGLTKHLSKLLSLNFIFCDGTNDSTGGRPSKRYTLDPDRSHILCVSLRKEKKETAMFQVVDLNNRPLSFCEKKSERLVPNDLFSKIEEIAKADPRLDLIVISFAGICSQGKIMIGDFDGLLGYDLKNEIRERFKIECVIENDVNCACIGYCQMNDQKDAAFLYIPKEEQVGCGFVLNGKLYNGTHHFAGELRYLPFQTLSLSIYIDTLSCVVAPKIIAIYDESDGSKKINSSIPSAYRPKIDWLDQFDIYIWNGLFYIAIDTLKHRKI